LGGRVVFAHPARSFRYKEARATGTVPLVPQGRPHKQKQREKERTNKRTNERTKDSKKTARKTRKQKRHRFHHVHVAVTAGFLGGQGCARMCV